MDTESQPCISRIDLSTSTLAVLNVFTTFESYDESSPRLHNCRGRGKSQRFACYRKKTGGSCRRSRGRCCQVPDLQSGQAGEGLERSEEHTSELQSRGHLVCRLL